MRVKHSLMIYSASQSVNIINCLIGLYLIVNLREQNRAPVKIESENVVGTHTQF